jgi:cytochrome c oxidase subunit IV
MGYTFSTRTNTLLYFYLKKIPHSLFKESGYDHREALFGMPPYGGSIAQNVYYADDTLCEDVDATKGYPARDVDPKTNKMKAWESPFILMVDRGSCTFVKKVGSLVVVVSRRQYVIDVIGVGLFLRIWTRSCISLCLYHFLRECLIVSSFLHRVQSASVLAPNMCILLSDSLIVLRQRPTLNAAGPQRPTSRSSWSHYRR